MVIGVGRELVGSDSLPDEVGFERGRCMTQAEGAEAARDPRQDDGGPMRNSKS